MRKLLVTLTVAGLAVAFGASPGVAGSGNVKKFCKAYLAANKTINADEPNLERLNRQLDTAVETAPAEIADAVSTAATAIQADPDAAFEDPAVGVAVGEVDSFAAENCADETIDVTFEDYAFTGLPDEIDAGVVGFKVTNEGAELHEMLVFRLKGDATLDDVLEASEEEAEELVTVVGATELPPGEAGSVVMQLKKPGKYAAVCFFPVGSTDEASAQAAEEAGAPPHVAEGMVAEFEVVK